MHLTVDGRAAVLGYSANVHPGETLDQVLAGCALAGQVRVRLGWPTLSLGLWLGRGPLDELAARGTGVLAEALAAAGLVVVTANAFPYGNFHADVVKRAVYHPDWTTEARAGYTIDVAAVLAELAPPGDATISTLPLAHLEERGGASAAPAAAAKLIAVARQLAALADRTGRVVRVCLEPEPGCALERTGDVVRFFAEHLAPAAVRAGLPAELVARHLGACVDVCHLAVAFEDPAAALAELDTAGVAIGKVQLSSALELEPTASEQRAALAYFAEPRFLHQVRAGRPGEGASAAADDLDQVDHLPSDRRWRVHHHVPIHREHVGGLSTTRDVLAAAIAALRARAAPLPHLEVETYTWSVLPGDEARHGDDLVAGLAAELSWVHEHLV